MAVSPEIGMRIDNLLEKTSPLFAKQTREDIQLRIIDPLRLIQPGGLSAELQRDFIIAHEIGHEEGAEDGGIPTYETHTQDDSGYVMTAGVNLNDYEDIKRGIRLSAAGEEKVGSSKGAGSDRWKVRHLCLRASQLTGFRRPATEIESECRSQIRGRLRSLENPIYQARRRELRRRHKLG